MKKLLRFWIGGADIYKSGDNMAKIMMMLIIIYSFTACSAKKKNDQSDNSGSLTRYKPVLTRTFDLRIHRNYDKLVERAKSQDSTLDFFDLRLAYYQKSEYSFGGVEFDDTKEQLFNAIQQKKWNDAIKFANVILENKFVDLDCHLYCAYSYNNLGDSSKARYHAIIYHKLLESLLTSGDGKSDSTAYVIIDESEEYIILDALDLKPREQALLEIDGKPYDLLTAIDVKNNKKKEVYFNKTLPRLKLDQLFNKKK